MLHSLAAIVKRVLFGERRQIPRTPEALSIVKRQASLRRQLAHIRADARRAESRLGR